MACCKNAAMLDPLTQYLPLAKTPTLGQPNPNQELVTFSSAKPSQPQHNINNLVFVGIVVTLPYLIILRHYGCLSSSATLHIDLG